MSIRIRTRTRSRRGARYVAAFASLALILAACGGAEEPGAEQETEDGAGEGDPEPEPEPEAEGEGEPEAEGEGEEAASFYEDGDLITVIVPFGEGGGTDTLARIAMPYLAEELGVDIQVENIPGAGSIPGVNQFQNQRNSQDGYTMMFHSASSQIPAILGEAGVDFSLEDQIPIAGFPLGGVIYASEDGPISEATDLAGPNQPEEFTYGGQPAAGGELRILLLFEMFQTDVNTVLGYDGRGASRLAWEQGESDLSYDTAPAYLANVEPLVEEGTAKPLMTFGFVDDDGSIIPDPQFPDIPSPGEVYEEAFGEPITEAGDAFAAYRTMALATLALNKTMIAHVDAPPEAIAELRSAWERMLENDEFLTTIEEELGGYPILLNEELESAWNQMSGVNTDAPEIQWLLEWVQDTYDVNLQEGED